jgi:hypothetical protein
VLGWARAGSQACHVQIQYRGETLAEAMATLFRPDLLRAGQGHGHCGFAARLRQSLPPGSLWLGLHLPQHGQTLPAAIHVPSHRLRGQASIESLMDEPPSWTSDDLLAAPACLDWEACLARLGPARFVDALTRFVFGRWPYKAESRLYTDTLARRRVSPQALLIDMLRSPERAESTARFPSPFDPAFPFAF